MEQNFSETVKNFVHTIEPMADGRTRHICVLSADTDTKTIVNVTITDPLHLATLLAMAGEQNRSFRRALFMATSNLINSQEEEPEEQED